METNEMLHGGIFLNASFFFTFLWGKMTFASQVLLWKIVFSFIYKSKGGSGALREAFILFLFLQLSGGNSTGLSWPGLEANGCPQNSLRNKISECLIGSILKMISGQPCFYSWGTWGLRRLDELLKVIMLSGLYWMPPLLTPNSELFLLYHIRYHLFFKFCWLVKWDVHGQSRVLANRCPLGPRREH